MRLIWKLDAGYDEPLCNKAVFALTGQLLGLPDLFDPVAGIVGEYGGGDHRVDDRRRSDRAREDRFLQHGLSYFELVTGDLSGSAHRRTTHASCPRPRPLCARGASASGPWTPPAWWTPPDWYRQPG